jgi:hypothetical protein
MPSPILTTGRNGSVRSFVVLTAGPHDTKTGQEMTTRTIVRLSVLLVVPGLLLLYFCIPERGLRDSFEREAKERTARMSESQLYSLLVTVADVQLRHRLSNRPLDSKTMVLEIAKNQGPSYLKCAASTNEWVSINPDFQNLDGSHFSNDAFAYCPYPGSNNSWIALLGGKVIVLSHRPKWQPIPIQSILESPTPLGVSRQPENKQ